MSIFEKKGACHGRSTYQQRRKRLRPNRKHLLGWRKDAADINFKTYDHNNFHFYIIWSKDQLGSFKNYSDQRLASWLPTSSRCKCLAYISFSSYSYISFSLNLFISYIIPSCFFCASRRMSRLIFIPNTNRKAANIRKIVSTTYLRNLERRSGAIILLIVLVGSFLWKNWAKEEAFSLENSINFLISSEVVIQKFAKARKATPNSSIERSPPIILNHSSTTFLS